MRSLAIRVKRPYEERRDLMGWLDQLVLELDMVTRSRDNFQREAGGLLRALDEAKETIRQYEAAA